jgi:PAS domain S-box-containing protein
MDTQEAPQALIAEIDDLRSRIELAEEALRAIRANEVDALVVGLEGAPKVRTLSGADQCYRTFVESMRQGAATVSPDGTILYCNRYFCDILRTSATSATGTSIFSYVQPSDEGLLRTMLWEAMATPTGNARFAMRSEDGKPVSAVLTATPLAAEGINHVCLVMTDLTEHEARLAAEAASQAKDRFLAALSHELRTPLMPAYMSVAAMENDESLPASVREQLTSVRRNLELETRLIDDMLDLSRIINGKLRLRLEPLSLHDLIHRVEEILRSDLRQKALRLELDLAANDTVEGDPSRLQQVLWNLLKNAIKFSSEGAKITIRTSNLDAQSIALEVIDQGVGIDPRLMPKIFNAFEQGDPALIRGQSGLGLGLSIAKPIVEAHGGTISASSDGAGKGAIFTMVLPRCTTAKVPTNRIGNGRDGQSQQRSLRVLLVEDHVETARLLGKLLEQFGHAVALAGDAKTALDLADKNPYDILVSDIGLPDANGYDLMKQIKSRFGLPGVALTGYGMDEDLQRSHEAGFADHVVKPVDAIQLEAVLCRVVNRTNGNSGANHP